MSRNIIIYGPSSRQKLVLVNDARMFELKNDVLKDYFDLRGLPLSLKPLSLSHESVKLEAITLAGGEEGFVLNADQHKFYKVYIDIADADPSVGLGLHNKEVPGCSTSSVINIIRSLPLNSSLHVALHSVTRLEKVQELPKAYDGYISFELPPCGQKSAMYGMEQKNDGHPWVEYVTCSSDCFGGVVRFSRCAGHLQCVNIDCPFYSRMGYQNETQWKGRLKRACLTGLVKSKSGNIACKHCGQMPICLEVCPAVIYYCIPKDHENTTRCAIHLGYHKHPYEEGTSRANEQYIEERVLTHASSNPFSTPKQLETMVTQDMIFDKLIAENLHVNQVIGDAEFAMMLDEVTPLSDRRRIERCLQIAKKGKNITSMGFEAVLDLKKRCRYPFLHSVLFPDQLGSDFQPHVFKMSTKGPGSGLDLVNRMRPGGDLKDMWVHFDHVHRVSGWPTMSAHVYDPFVRELLTIATCEFRVEDRYAQIQFWKMLNSVVQEQGFGKPEFHGFMADEANANWLAVRTVYFGGAKRKVPEKERSCVFHWEQSMVRHTHKCIRPSFHEEHKFLCRKWRVAPSEVAAEQCKDEIRRFWQSGHAVAGEIPALETWLAWWDVRAFHWGAWLVTQSESGAFIPTTNLSEVRHASMRASVGYKNQISLYEATCVDMSMGVLQSVKYHAYLKGIRTGTGPGMQALADRFLNRDLGTRSGKRLIDLTHASMEEMGVHSPEMHRGKRNEHSIRKKRPPQMDPGVVHEDDSHRPEYVTVTANRQKESGQTRNTPSEGFVEKKVSNTIWAIRRTEPTSKVTCFGRLSGQSGRCGALIADGNGNKVDGIPAPSFWGRRKYPGGIVSGFIWFCNISPTHSWDIDESQVIGVPGAAPGVWPVAEGTALNAMELEMLEASGFVIRPASSNRPASQPVVRASNVASNYRPKYRDGKVVKWRSRLTKDFNESIERGRALVAQLVREAIVVCNESHIFYISTEGSRALGVNYSVTISDFPRCTCEGFQRQESKRLTFMPCKHIYFVYLKVLGLDATIHEFMHQAALTKVELFQALSGRRCVLVP